MTSQELLDPIRFIVAEVMATAVDNVTIQSTNLNLEGWDSLRHLTLISTLCDTFDIEIEDDEIEECLEITGIISLVERKTG